MKYIILTTYAVLFFNFCFAIEDNSKKSSWLKFDKQNEILVDEMLSNKKLLNLTEDDELKLISTKTDQLGFTHQKYQQYHCNIPVENATYLFHTKNKKVNKSNGKLAVDINVNGSSSPLINSTNALEKALNIISAKEYAWENDFFEKTYKQAMKNKMASFYPNGELVWFDVNGSYRLAYKFEIYALKPHSRKCVYIDANDGTHIKSIEKIHNCMPTSSTGLTNYSGEVNFTACKNENGYVLKDSTDVLIQVFDAKNSNLLLPNIVTDDDGHFDTDNAATEVYWATSKAKEYFFDTFNRNSIDDNGMAMISWVHYTNKQGEGGNAYWDGSFMLYGDGENNKNTSLTSPDIVAHEITHGITDFSANLSIFDEPGALNESFSDIFGIAFKAYCRSEIDWIIGSDYVTQNEKNGARNLSNPKDQKMLYIQPDTYKGKNWDYSLNDFGGVHTNSGVQNYWFYLLTEGGQGTNDNGEPYNIEGIGIDKAIQIAYRNLNYYLSSNSEYIDAMEGAIEAAIDLYGEDSFEVEQTIAAWCAVGVGSGCPEAPVVSACSLSDSLALISIYNKIDADSWPDRWDITNTSMDDWAGVILNEDRCVTELEIDGRGLIGSIAQQIGYLSKLEFLNLSENALSGEIPASIGNLENLKYLSLDYNQLSGSIPSSIKNLNRLEYLYLGNNLLNGTIPSYFNFNLKNLSLNNNQLSGVISSNLINQNLENLNLSNNNLTGTVPDFGYTNLKSIDLSHNQLNGYIPTSYSKNSQLYTIKLNDNLLTGTFPAEVGNLPVVTSIRLENNLLDGCFHANLRFLCSKQRFDIDISNNGYEAVWEDFCDDNLNLCRENHCRAQDSISLLALNNSIKELNWDLRQPIDTWDGVELNINGCVESLDISDEGFRGNIPPEIGSFLELQYLALDENYLEGEIPPEIGNLTKLKHLGLDDNRLGGKIPSEIGNLKSLEYLNLSDNQLTDFIPNEISNLFNLQKLLLRNNDLTGDLSFIDGLTNLLQLVASSNNIYGSIPTSINALKNLEWLMLDNNNLTSFLPNDFLKDINVELIDISNNYLQGCYPFSMDKLCNMHSLNNQYSPISEGNNFNMSFNSHCFEDFPCEFMPTCRKQDSITLTIVHKALKGQGSNAFDFWNLEQPMNTWQGVQLNEYGCVRSIKIYEEAFNGALPPEIGNLFNLDTLILSDCNLQGNIPREIGNLYTLKLLDLSQNNLSSKIPREIGNLFNLKSLALNNNELDWVIPEILSELKQLEYLNLKNNNLVGGIPHSISNLTQLYFLDITNNNLETCYHRLLKPLCNQLGPNAFIDEGNDIIFKWFDFCEKNTGMCAYPGPCQEPDSLILVSLYSELDGPNWVDWYQWDFSKPMKDWEGITINYEGCVEKINLSAAGLVGNFPEDVINMIFLEELDLSNNQLTGEIPLSIKMAQLLKTLNLGSNNLSGHIPAQISDLQLLKTLNLASNSLTGNIPNLLAGLPELGNLDIQNNQLSGCYRSELHFWCDNKNFKDWHISEGNDFKASWSDFCDGKDGYCDICGPEILVFDPCWMNDPITLSEISKSLSGLGWDQNMPKPSELWNGEDGIIWDEHGCVKELILPADNTISGILPPEIGKLKNLEVLKISNNKNIIGYLPDEFDCLTNLKTLVISNTGISGSIPESIYNLEKLTKLHLNNNNLSGIIPANLGYNSFGYNGELFNINLSNNWLSGCYAPRLNQFCHLNNEEISDGNSFSATWEDFCQYGSGSCISNCRQTDSLTLIALYNSVNGYEPNMATSIEEWPGVSALNEEGCVSKLVLGENLSGILPPDIGKFGSLTELVITNNNISGSLPWELHNLKKLTIQNTDIRGDFTALLSAKKLQYFKYENNNNSGNLVFPITLLRLKDLGYLSLAGNGFRGTIPHDIDDLENLVELYLENNQFEGVIPSTLANLSNLQVVNLSNNLLSGCFHESMLLLCDQLAPFSLNYYISDRNLFDATWLEFCEQGIEACDTADVWPGDFDNNGIVDKDDLLYYGLAVGNTGPARNNASTNWLGQPGTNWQSSINGVNGKHQDADGNGIVEQSDIQTIIDNYGNNYISNHSVDGIVDNPVSLRLVPIGLSQTEYGIAFEYDLLVVSTLNNSPNVHGISGSIDFSRYPLKGVEVDFTDSSLLPNEHIYFFDEERGTLDIAITRTDGTNEAIDNALAKLLVIIDNIPTGDPYKVYINGGSTMSANGVYNSIGGTTLNGFFPSNPGFLTELAATVVSFDEQCNNLGSARVDVLNGKAPYNYNWSTGEITNQINNLHSNDYSVTITDANNLSATIQFQIKGVPQVFDENDVIICEKQCPNYLTTYPYINAGLHKAAKTLNTNGKIYTDVEVELMAGESIILENGFEIEQGAELTIDIEDCE